MKVIGLTGGIGSGKSTVADRLRQKGYRVLDADQIAKDIVRPGMPALSAIAETFGAEFLDENGELRRKELAAHITANPAAKRTLDALMHTEVIGQIKEEVEEARLMGLSAVFLDVPLLFEVGLDAICDESWLVTAPENVRIQRVVARDGVSEELVRGYIANQMPEEEKRKRAQRVFDNAGDLSSLYDQLAAALVAVSLGD